MEAKRLAAFKSIDGGRVGGGTNLDGSGVAGGVDGEVEVRLTLGALLVVAFLFSRFSWLFSLAEDDGEEFKVAVITAASFRARAFNSGWLCSWTRNSINKKRKRKRKIMALMN